MDEYRDEMPHDGVWLFGQAVKIGAVVTILALLAAFVGNIDFAEELTLEAMEKEARPARVAEILEAKADPCDFTITQFGPGERWAPKQPDAKCVAAAKALPNYVLTLPIERGSR
jgi:hypothetical protein